MGSPRVAVEERTFTFRYPSAEDFVAFFRTWYGPTLKAFETLDPAGQSALEAALVDLARGHDRAPDGAFAVDATYLEAIAGPLLRRRRAPLSAIRPSGRIAPERLAHAVDAAAGAAGTGSCRGRRPSKPSARSFAFRSVDEADGEHAVVAERDHVAAEAHRVAEAHRHDLDPSAAQPVDDLRLGGVEADGGELLGQHADHQVDVDVVLVDRRVLDLEALASPSSRRPACAATSSPRQPV